MLSLPSPAIQTVIPPSAAALHHASALDVSSVSQKDTTYTKIFVGGLPYHTTDKSLREHFEVYGEIEEAVVITDRQTGKSRGYGFVTMADRAGAERAIKDPNPVIDGRKANVNLAYIGAKPRGQTTAYSALQHAALRYYPHLTTAAANPYALTAAAAPAQYLYQPTYIPAAAAAAAATHVPMVTAQHPSLNPSGAVPVSVAYTSAGAPAAAAPTPEFATAGATYSIPSAASYPTTATIDPYTMAISAAFMAQCRQSAYVIERGQDQGMDYAIERGIPGYNYLTTAGSVVSATAPAGAIPLTQAYAAAPPPQAQLQEARMQ